MDLFLQLNSKWSLKTTVTCYELSTQQKSSSLLSNRATVYSEAEKKAASSRYSHSIWIWMHAVLPSFLSRELLDGSTYQFLARDWQNRTRTAAITVVCDYLSPNKSDPPVWSTHTHKKKKVHKIKDICCYGTEKRSLCYCTESEYQGGGGGTIV